MKKAELVKAVATKTGMTNDAANKAVTATVEAITEALANGDNVQLIGFGTFEVRERSARTGLNPRTKETIEIPASKQPAFKAGAALKNAVAK